MHVNHYRSSQLAIVRGYLLNKLLTHQSEYRGSQLAIVRGDQFNSSRVFKKVPMYCVRLGKFNFVTFDVRRILESNALAVNVALGSVSLHSFH